eukprot:TRINITY_DN9017_c0_g1_i1.p1 TRINITY_DN9017_c0_g1~~TRINITY_DN9017_c0_g1_i1.p1  ORF type:complete len:373 (+),score=88.62 TRINITY_DN9017_c0_g1_i1:24-1142(+)
MSGKVQFVRKVKPSSTTSASSNTSSSLPFDVTPAVSSTRGIRSWANQITLASSGNNSLDAILGFGVGVPLGTVLFCIEDFPSRVHRQFAAMFVAECITHGHTLAMPNTITARNLLNNCIPAQGSPSKNKSKTSQKEEKRVSEMSIAWRYEKYVNQPSAENKEAAARSSNLSGTSLVTGGGLAGTYDFRQKVHESDMEELLNNRTRLLGNDEFVDQTFLDELEFLLDHQGNFVTRVLIPSFGDLSFGDELSKLKRFLARLRLIIDGKKAVVMVTVPRVLFDEVDILAFEAFADASFHLSAFLDAEHAFGDSHGILCIRKLFHVNTFGCQYPDQTSYLYTIGKKGLFIERLYMPPEESRTGNSAATSSIKSVDF